VAQSLRATVERALELEAKSPGPGKRVLAGELQGSKALAAVKLEKKNALAAEIRAAPPSLQGPLPRHRDRPAVEVRQPG